MSDEYLIERLDVSVYTIPTEIPEADGTLAWDATSRGLVEPHTRGGTVGLGYAFGNAATGTLVRDLLAGIVVGRDVATPRARGRRWSEASATSVDRESARWRSRPSISRYGTPKRDAPGQPLFRLLGPARQDVPVYGSGGSTTYSQKQLIGSSWLGRARHPAGEDENRNRSRRVVAGRHSAHICCSRGARSQRRALCRCQWRAMTAPRPVGLGCALQKSSR